MICLLVLFPSFWTRRKHLELKTLITVFVVIVNCVILVFKWKLKLDKFALFLLYNTRTEADFVSLSFEWLQLLVLQTVVPAPLNRYASYFFSILEVTVVVSCCLIFFEFYEVHIAQYLLIRHLDGKSISTCLEYVLCI